MILFNKLPKCLRKSTIIKLLNSFALFSLISIICGCGGNYTNVDYVRYFGDESNGLIISNNIDGVKITCEFKTPEYILLREKSKEISTLDSIKLSEQEISELDNVYFLKLKFSSSANKDFLKSKIQNESEYFSRLQYLQSNIAKDLVLISDKDTLNCSFSEFERDFGLSGKVTLNLGFLKEGVQTSVDDLTLIFNDQKFNLGVQKFTFLKKNIIAIPKYKVI
jgi:hypothetical protein